MYDSMEISGNTHVYIVTQSVRYICNTCAKVGTCRQILVELSNKSVVKFCRKVAGSIPDGVTGIFH